MITHIFEEHKTILSPMANQSNMLTYFSLLFLLLSHCNYASSSSSSSCFKSIIGFGNSIVDTGNLPELTESNTPLFFEVLPYGETFFHRPTGRCSDGRLIIDFTAEYLGLPFVPPFYGGEDFSGGSSVNFAVAGANALSDSFFQRRGVEIRRPNITLVDQLNWLKKVFLPKFYPKTSDSKRFLESSFFLVGEIGGNDYNHALLLGGKNKEFVETFIPRVVKVIASTLNEMIKLGAVTLMVPGNFPIGCFPAYLTMFQDSNQEDYDSETGCITWLNKVSESHNKLLQLELGRIQKENPYTTIIYADYYNAAMTFYRSPEKYGFTKGALTACCPTCGTYNIDPTMGEQGSKVCKDPSQYVSWDGFHLTEAAYGVLTTAIFRGSNYTIPKFDSVCDLSFVNKVARISDH